VTRLEEFKERVGQMLEQGCVGFGFSPGPKWWAMSGEERADAVLTAWDAVAEQVDVKDLGCRTFGLSATPISSTRTFYGSRTLTVGPSESSAIPSK
jgi:hypothetical protein